MLKATIALTAAVLLGSVAVAQTTGKKFKSFSVHSHDGKSPEFQFSEADATSDSPVVISIDGRKLTNEDRKYRTDLQKVWLSENVPKNLQFSFRSLDMCGLKRDGEYPFCDHYQFVDPKTKERFHYYIYIGNWP